MGLGVWGLGVGFRIQGFKVSDVESDYNPKRQKGGGAG